LVQVRNNSTATTYARNGNAQWTTGEQLSALAAGESLRPHRWVGRFSQPYASFDAVAAEQKSKLDALDRAAAAVDLEARRRRMDERLKQGVSLHQIVAESIAARAEAQGLAHTAPRASEATRAPARPAESIAARAEAQGAAHTSPRASEAARAPAAQGLAHTGGAASAQLCAQRQRACRSAAEASQHTSPSGSTAAGGAPRASEATRAPARPSSARATPPSQVRVNPFITPARLHYPHYCNTLAQLLRNI